MTPKLLREREAADFLGVSDSCLQKWRWKNTGPKYVRLGRSIRYALADLEEFVRTNITDPMSTNGGVK